VAPKLSPDLQAAIAMSNDKAAETERQLRQETVIKGVLGRPDTPYTSGYLDTALSNIGLSYWKIFFILAAIFATAIYFHLPPVLIDLAKYAVGAYVLYAFADRFIFKRPRK
jgi:hypothetical protein